MNERVDASTGEILDRVDQLPATVDTNMAVAVTRAQLDVQVTTARAFPRSVQTAVNDILSLSTMNEQMASECVYALPRSDKPIRGASIRLAEVIAQCWGNCVSEARIISIDKFNKMVTAEGIFHDLQTNTITKATAERRISTKDGRLFGDDMIAVTCNAARSIARRNAILAGVPKVIWMQAYQQCEKVIAGNVTTLTTRRAEAIKAFAAFGLKPEQIFQVLDVKGEADVGLDELVTLRGAYSGLKNGEMTVEELLASRAPPAQQVTPAGRKTLDDFAAGKTNGKTEHPTNEEAQTQAGPIAPAEGQGAPDNQAGPQTGVVGSPNTGVVESGAPAAKAKVAETAADKAKPAPNGPKGPKTEAEYVAHANEWREEIEDADLLEQQWKSEKSMRNKSNVTLAVREELMAKVDAKSAKLRGQAVA